MKIFIVSEKSYEIKQVRDFFERLPYADFGKENVLDFYQEEAPKTALERLETDAAKRNYYDLLVVSHKMKTLPGIMFARSASTRQSIVCPPIMLVVDQITKDLVKEAMVAGVSGFFSFPLTKDGLQASMTRLASILLLREQKKVREELARLKSNPGADAELSETIYRSGAKGAEKSRMFAPWSEETHTALASLCMDAGDHHIAIGHLKAALRINAKNRETHHALLACYKKTGQAMEESSTLKNLLISDPKSPELLVKLGDAILREGNFKEAALYFRKAIASHGPADSARLKARSHVGLGKALMTEGDETPDPVKHEMARDEFSRAVSADPTLVSAYLNLLASCKKLGLEKEAREILEKAVRIAPDCAEGWLDLFSHYLDEGEMQKAKFSLQRAMQYDPESQVVLVLAGQIYLKHRLFGEAVALFEKAVSINPGDTRIYNFLGIGYRRMEMNEQAIANFQKAIDIDPTDCNLHYNLGRAYQQMNNLAAAKTEFEASLNLNKDFAEARMALAGLTKSGGAQLPEERTSAG